MPFEVVERNGSRNLSLSFQANLSEIPTG
jgi:hypothetical protein